MAIPEVDVYLLKIRWESESGSAAPRPVNEFDLLAVTTTGFCSW